MQWAHTDVCQSDHYSHPISSPDPNWVLCPKVMLGQMMFVSPWCFRHHHPPPGQEGAGSGNLQMQLWDNIPIGHSGSWSLQAIQSALSRAHSELSGLTRIRWFLTIHRERGPWQKLYVFWPYYTNPPKFYDFDLLCQSHCIQCQLSITPITMMHFDSSICHPFLDLCFFDVTDAVRSCSFMCISPNSTGSLSKWYFRWRRQDLWSQLQLLITDPQPICQLRDGITVIKNVLSVPLP